MHQRGSDKGGTTTTSPSSKTDKAKLVNLPGELVANIAKYVYIYDDLSRLVRTCRHFNNLLGSELYKRSCQQGHFALLWAAKRGSVATTEQALTIGANVNIQADGFIKLATGISQYRRSPTFSFVQLCYDIHCKTPLMLAAEEGHTEVIQLLLQQPEINVSAEIFGLTALHYAALNGHVAAFELLLSCNASQINWNSLARTPLHLAASNGHERIVSLLLKLDNIKVVGKDPCGLTALHLAARNGHARVVAELLRHKDMDVNMTDTHGYTPLHLAIRNEHMPTIKTLLNHGSYGRSNFALKSRHSLLLFQVLSELKFRHRGMLRRQQPGQRWSAYRLI